MKRTGKRISKVIKKASAVLLAAVVLLGSAPLIQNAGAYSLKEPTVTLEEYNDYKGVKIFINGRLVEFNDSLGYPFIEHNRTMIPLRAVAETFDACVNWNSKSRRAYVAKDNEYVRITIGEKEIKLYDEDFRSKTYEMDVEAVIRNNRTYIPLRAVFECFGMNVRWDKNTRIAHIETIDENAFDNIDFKDKEVFGIQDIDLTNVGKIMYDGVEVDKSYVEILKNSNQYKVVEDEGVTYIFSYQYLRNLNFVYGKLKECMSNSLEGQDTDINFQSDETMEFYEDRLFSLNTDQFISISSEEITAGNIHSCYVSYGEWGIEVFKKAKEIAEDIKVQTSDPVEQIRLANKYLCDNVEYGWGGSAYEAFFEGNAICQGYDAAFAYIMRYLEIPCISITGSVAGYPHAWSNVYVNGEWKVVDVTWNDDGYRCDSYLLLDLDDSKLSQRKIHRPDDDFIFKLTYKFY